MKKIILLVIQSLFLSACFLGDGVFSSQDALFIAPSKESDRDRRERRRDSENLRRGDCGDHSDCEDICEDVYEEGSDDDENDGRIEKCLELPYAVAVSFEDIVEALEDPAYSVLKNIDERDFLDFLDVSLDPWVEFIRGMRSSEAKNLLRWIASEQRVAESIVRAHRNFEDFDRYEGVYKLLQDVALDDRPGDIDERECAEICSAVFTVSIGGNRSFSDIVIEVRNRPAVCIALNLIDNICQEVNNIREISECDIDLVNNILPRIESECD